MSLPPVFLADPRPARVPRTAEADEAPLIITTLGATAELVANLLKALDGSDHSGKLACDMAAKWVGLSLRAHAPAKQEEFWGQLTEAVFGEYGTSMEVLLQSARPSMQSRANPTELLNQRMFYNACRERAGLAARPKPFPLQYEDRELFHVGAYVLALVGNAATVQLGFPSETYEWIASIIAGMNRTKSPLLKDAAFALAFMQRTLAYIVTAVSPTESVRQRKQSWTLKTGRKSFPGPFDDEANIAFRVFLYQNSIPDDWTDLGSEEEDGSLDSISENLTPLGEALMKSETFVVNMLEVGRYEVFLYVPEGSSLWRHPSVLAQMSWFRGGIDRNLSADERRRCEWGLFDFALQAKKFDFLPDNAHWWLNVMANFKHFAPWCLSTSMIERRLTARDEDNHWEWFINQYMTLHEDDSELINRLLEDVTKYMHGMYAAPYYDTPPAPLPIAFDPWFWTKVFALKMGRFKVQAFRALRSIAGSIGHDQPTLVTFVESQPGLLNLVDEFRLENTPELKALVDSMAFVQLWAAISTVGMPSYFAEYEEIVAAFASTMIRIQHIYASIVYDDIISKLIHPLSSELQRRWLAALAKARLEHDATPSEKDSDSDW